MIDSPFDFGETVVVETKLSFSLKNDKRAWTGGRGGGPRAPTRQQGSIFRVDNLLHVGRLSRAEALFGKTVQQFSVI